jgi:hypothetical protein
LDGLHQFTGFNGSVNPSYAQRIVTIEALARQKKFHGMVSSKLRYTDYCHYCRDDADSNFANNDNAPYSFLIIGVNQMDTRPVNLLRRKCISGLWSVWRNPCSAIPNFDKRHFLSERTGF